MDKRVAICALALLPLVSCASHLRDPLARAHRVKPGITRAEVVKLLGPPPWTSMSPVEEWRYCRIDDVILAIFFREGAVVDKVTYQVDVSDNGGEIGGRINYCPQTIKDNGPAWAQKVRERARGL